MLKPLGDRVVIRVAKEEEKTVGGIVLASVAKEKRIRKRKEIPKVSKQFLL